LLSGLLVTFYVWTSILSNVERTEASREEPLYEIMKIAIEENTETAHVPWDSRLPSSWGLCRASSACIDTRPAEKIHMQSHISQFHCPELQKRDHSNISYLI